MERGLCMYISKRWSFADRRFRMVIEFKADGYARFDKTAEVYADFTKILHDAGGEGMVNVNTLRMSETDRQGNVVDEYVHFQFDRDPTSYAAGEIKGTLIFRVKGMTSPEDIRIFQVYFDTAGAVFIPAIVPPLVTLIDPVIDEQQECFRIITPHATYDYQKLGGGFSSILDEDGNDWLNYRPGGGSAGEYRGIPNTGVFHPGYVNAWSKLMQHGPLKTTLYSETVDGQNACKWEIYPERAVFTMLKSLQPFWFLYEGTPGGKFDQDRDYIVRCTGERSSAAKSWHQTMAGPKWVCFGDSESDRVLYLAHHEKEQLTDSYWAMNREMTVFGFGRAPQGEELTRYLTHLPNRVTIGFYDGGEFDQVKNAIDSSFREYASKVVGVERND